ncbi:MAG: hypothetical protein ACI959_001404, partial [Limisphaerales bacterium]
PAWSDEPPPPVEQNDRNTLTVLINSNDQLLVEEEIFDVIKLRDYAKNFIVNNGKNPELSDSPQKAIVSFKGDVGTSYDMYISVYNELRAAYNELRNEETSKKTNGRVKTFSDLDRATSDSLIYKEIKFLVPARLSEAEPTNLGK